MSNFLPRSGWLAAGLLALVVLSALNVGQPALGSQATPTAPDVAYLALGDSVAAGIGASPPAERGYPALLAERLDGLFGVPVRRINLAVPGETTASLLNGEQMERALRVLASAGRSGITIGTITLTIGANDLLRADPNAAAREAALKTIDENVRTILARIRDASTVGGGAPQTELVVSGYYDPTGSPADVQGSDGWWLARLDDTLEAASTESGARWVDVASVFVGRADDLTWYPRDIHPTEAGHAVIAGAIWKVVTGGSARVSNDPAATTSAGLSLADRWVAPVVGLGAPINRPGAGRTGAVSAGGVGRFR